MNSIKEFLERYPLASYGKGETILLKEVVPSHVFIVKTGVVKVSSISASGDEQAVSFDTEGELFPIGWAVGAIERTQYFYTALTKVTAYKVPRKDYQDYLATRPHSMLVRYQELAARLVSMQERINALQQPKASDKILHTLLYMAHRFGAKVSVKTARLKIPITQQELALFVGLTRETTSIELKKLEKAGLISYSRNAFFVHTKKVESAIEKE